MPPREIHGMAALRGNLAKAKHNLEHRLNRVVLKAGLVVAGQAQRNVSGPRPRHLGVDTGRLKGSIISKIVRYGAAKIGTNVEYARIHEYGGMIFAKRGIEMTISRGPTKGAKFTTRRPWLRFKVGNQWVVTDRVRIPRRSYLEPALKAKRRTVVKIIRSVYAGPLRLGGVEVGNA